MKNLIWYLLIKKLKHSRWFIISGFYGIGLTFLMFVQCVVYSAYAGDNIEMKINISGSIIVTGKCTFDEGRDLLIDFGKIRFNPANNLLIDKYTKLIANSMTCSGDVSGTAKMMLSSKDGSFLDYNGRKILGVGIVGGGSNSGLGIALKVNDQIQDINIPFAVDLMAVPVMEAELVQVDISKRLVSDNTITSSATLVMTFD
jgi:hypothetical protein